VKFWPAQHNLACICKMICCLGLIYLSPCTLRLSNSCSDTLKNKYSDVATNTRRPSIGSTYVDPKKMTPQALSTLQPPRKQRPAEPAEVFPRPIHKSSLAARSSPQRTREKARPTERLSALTTRCPDGTAGARPGRQEKRPGRHLPSSTLVPATIAPRVRRRDGRVAARARRGAPGRRRHRRR
jgi:hypothetical protein